VAILVATLIGASAPAFADERGRRLFEEETFGGNGRTCQSCHTRGSRTISPEQAQALFAQDPGDPLFQGDARDDFGSSSPLPCLGAAPSACGATFDRFLAHATIVVGIDLHEAVTVDDTSARRVFLNRGIPSTVDTPALVLELMSDGRAPTLQAQARDALAGHANVHDVRDSVLNKIAAFESTEFSRPELESFALGGPPPTLPEGSTEAERRGRTFFVAPTEIGKEGFCGMCHSGPMLDTSAIALPLPGGDGLPTLIGAGARFSTTFVSERNALGNPLRLWTIRAADGTARSIVSPDIGRAAITGLWADVNEFKIPSLWNSRNTAPYFHDNSAKTLEEVVDHYLDIVAPTFGLSFTEEERADILAYLRLL
jgi:cytochrome c peroxidase